ncbi:MAG: pyridoxamine 5'-phosphate oxidase family protein [Hydrogenophaga sp.]|nr:pyridoxamine 5'-phosphate oxidase family protein [Hydrogenophaga sp.]
MHTLTRALARLLREQRVASLATLDANGLPQLSLVPFAIDTDALVIHVSALAAHTAALERQPRAALMVHEGAPAQGPVHALHRVALQVQARLPPAHDPSGEHLRTVYLARFPEALPMTSLGDFRFVRLGLIEARQVAGFGAARSLNAEELVQALAQAMRPDGHDAA